MRLDSAGDLVRQRHPHVGHPQVAGRAQPTQLVPFPCLISGHLLRTAFDRGFFEACDGIFLNYCWKKANLEASLELAALSDRQMDVYVGML